MCAPPIHFNGAIWGGLCEVPGFIVLQWPRLGCPSHLGQSLLPAPGGGRMHPSITPTAAACSCSRLGPSSVVCNAARDGLDSTRKKGAERNVSVLPGSLRWQQAGGDRDAHPLVLSLLERAGLAVVWLGDKVLRECIITDDVLFTISPPSLLGQGMEKPPGLCWIPLSFTPKAITPWWAAALHVVGWGPTVTGWPQSSPQVHVRRAGQWVQLQKPHPWEERQSSSVALQFAWLQLAWVARMVDWCFQSQLS